MKQHYFVVVLAHSLHGRLRRIHVRIKPCMWFWRWRCLARFRSSGWFRATCA